MVNECIAEVVRPLTVYERNKKKSTSGSLQDTDTILISCTDFLSAHYEYDC